MNVTGSNRPSPWSSGASLRFFAVASHGLEETLAQELRELGLHSVAARRGGASFRGRLADGYRVCLWSRTAVRVLLELHRFPGSTPGEVYDGVQALDWTRHIDSESTLACSVVGMSHALRNTRYTAQVVKDAVVDQMRERTGARPGVDQVQPDIRLHLVLHNGRALLSLDLSGEPLHRRGYRRAGAQTEAPLKETLAAGMLRLAGWPSLQDSAVLHDPMCGSGTLVIEGAMMAADVAPGLLRNYWGFMGWKGHDEQAWSGHLAEAQRRRDEGVRRLQDEQAATSAVRFWGGDRDEDALSLAREAASRAGLEGVVQFSKAEIGRGGTPPPAARESARAGAPARAPLATPGLVATNPPYGERMSADDPDVLYHALARALKERYVGWRAAVLVADARRAVIFGPDVDASAEVMNGPIACRVLRFDVARSVPAAERRRRAEEKRREREPLPKAAERKADRPEVHAVAGMEEQARPPGLAAEIEPRAAGVADMAVQELTNRLRRNHRHLGRQMRRHGIDCYRVYDADLPEYAVAVDLYGEWAHVQEYAPPPQIDPHKAAARLEAALAVLPEALGIDPGKIVLKVRRRQRGGSQYERLASSGEMLEVGEGDLRFLVNLTDRIDTGLFPQLRLVRAKVRELARGTRFLNLFGYTGTATVAAARGGAISTLTVDLSSTYLEWARQNFALNGLRPDRNALRRADCQRWLSSDEALSDAWDLILLAPPTHSRSKGAETLDLTRDYPRLLTASARLLAPGGRLLFVAGARRLRLDSELLPGLELRDISRATLPPDFTRRAAFHHCWEITRVFR